MTENWGKGWTCGGPWPKVLMKRRGSDTRIHYRHGDGPEPRSIYVREVLRYGQTYRDFSTGITLIWRVG